MAERWSRCCPNHATQGTDFSVLHSVRQIPSKQAELFGYNSRPKVDLPEDWVATPTFPAVSAVSPPNQAYLAYSAIGQFPNVKASALSNVLVAAGIANHGIVMKPYLVQQVTDNAGATVSTAKPAAWMTAATPASCGECHFSHGVGCHKRNRRWGWILIVTRCGGKNRNRTDGKPSGQHGRLDDRLRTGE